MKPSEFLYTVCQVGAEPALKKELARDYPALRFAYSRPGFVTFKDTESKLTQNFGLRSVFARAFGLSLGAVPKKGEPLESLAQAVWERISQETPDLSARAQTKIKVHVFERDQHVPSEEPMGYLQGAWAERAEKALTETRPQSIQAEINTPAKLGDLVFDVVVLEQNEWWLGLHEQTRGHSPFPGGRPKIPYPNEAPSRAYTKLQEALLWSEAPIIAGDTAVEIGSAPGGACYALLKHGLKVVGIDPGKMDPMVMLMKGYQHISKSVNLVPREELPPSVEWLLLDMNVPPSASLFVVDRLASRMKDCLLGVILTVKLNNWKFADEIPGMREHLRAMGMTRVRARQLASNRQEFCLYGLTRKGGLRIASRE